ncbi:hypothetical protein GCM10009836_60490 [Pseudonocardia ailaonensis]|uniref:DUF4386 domain-containing protein n=1 Tax=Pseudonocardia ailaonensis TaxID=367279 RepID=A0ABN2NJ59_9PSEU
MTTTAPPRPTTADPLRRRAFAAGVFYLVTFVSIPTLALYGPLGDPAAFLLGSGSGTAVLWGALSEVVVAIACVGTAVVLFPVTRRHGETAALGFVASRTVEATLILAGVAIVLTMVGLRGDPAAAALGPVLSTGYDKVFLLSQSLAPVFNALCLGTVLYRSGLVPRVLPLLGLIGAPLLLASDVAVLFGLYDRNAPLAALLALPIAAWELGLGIYLVAKGFRGGANAPRATAGVTRPA